MLFVAVKGPIFTRFFFLRLFLFNLNKLLSTVRMPIDRTELIITTNTYRFACNHSRNSNGDRLDVHLINGTTSKKKNVNNNQKKMQKKAIKYVDILSPLRR